VTELLAAGHTPLTGWIPLGMLGYDAHRGLPFDPARARKLLAEAGYGAGKKLPRVTINFNTNENHQRIAENVQAQLRKNLDVAVELQNEDFKSFLSRLNSDPPQIFRLGWVADFPDPATFTSLMTSYSENNHSRWKNKAYDDLHAEASRTLDREKRRAVYARLQKLLNEDEVPVMPIYSWVDHYMVSDRVRDLPLTAARSFPFKGVSFK
jgi:oligopeptide transport system substrate-binding protein